MANKLISIIIPVYNVSKYIEKCILSCIHQTYENIEVIVVDDGSTDSSGSIIDNLSKVDNRIRVYHKKNEGVSRARNFGIEHASGEFLVFVDGDDYISNDFIEYMYKIVDTTNSQFGLSLNCYTDFHQKQCSDKIEKYNKLEATELLLSDKIEVGCWNKIYSKDLFYNKNLRFLEDLFYGEGLEFIIRVAQNSNSIGVGNRRVYYYRKNNMSSATTKFNYDKYINGEKSLLIIKENLDNSNERIESNYNVHYSMFCINALIGVIGNKGINDYKEKYKYWLKRIKKYYKLILFDPNVSMKKKIKIIIARFFPRIILIRNHILNKTRISNSI